jgi:hypothetical protein
MLGPSSSFSSYLHASASGPLHCSTCIQTTPIINQDCRYYLGPTRHQNRKRVRLLRLCPQQVGQSWKRRRCGYLFFLFSPPRFEISISTSLSSSLFSLSCLSEVSFIFPGIVNEFPYPYGVAEFHFLSSSSNFDLSVFPVFLA